MKPVIIDKRKTIFIDEVPEGTVFEAEETWREHRSFYMKTPLEELGGGLAINAVDLYSGQLCYIAEDIPITLINSVKFIFE